jgi:hypothetical protein
VSAEGSILVIRIKERKKETSKTIPVFSIVPAASTVGSRAIEVPKSRSISRSKCCPAIGHEGKIGGWRAI